MYLKNLTIQNFKSYDKLSLSLSPGLNCFVGDNGVGKTNLLDAIFYLSLTKSFFNGNDYDVMKFEESFFTLTGQYQRDKHTEEIHCAYSKDKKKTFKRNQKKYKRISDHIGFIPVVMISPSDINLIVDGSEVRRRFVDVVIAQYDQSYILSLLRYNKALKNRNILLKKQVKNNYFDKDTLSVYEDIMTESGHHIHNHRRDFIESLSPLFNHYYKLLISGKEEKTKLEYKSQLNEHPLSQLLDNTREKDRILQHTSAGVHRDDLIMLLDNKPIKHFGSQGQQKTYLTALKFAKYEYIFKQQEKKPLLLLDDIFDKFDQHRVEQIIKIVSGDQFGQIFITDTNKDRLDHILNRISEDHRIFEVSGGKVHPL